MNWLPGAQESFMYDFTSLPASRVICQKPTASPTALTNGQLTLLSGWCFFAWAADGDKELVGVTSFCSLGVLYYLL